MEMRTSLAILALVVVAAFASSALAVGSVNAFSFNPNTILDNYSPTVGDNVSAGQTRADQPDARRLYGVGPGGNVSTYNRGGGGQAEYNTYANWQQSMGPGEGLRGFELWLAPNFSYTTSFGDTLGYAPQFTDGYPTVQNNAVLSVHGADGWTCDVLHDGPYYPILYWHTSDPTKYLRPGGTTIGDFGFTANTAVYNDSTYTGEVQDGSQYRVFFWGLSADQKDTGFGFGDGLNDIVADGSGFGTTGPNQGTFDLNNTTGWQFYASGELTAQAVPEPITMTLVGMGIFGLGGYIRRRAKAAK